MIVPKIPAYEIKLTESSLAEKRAAIETLQEIVVVESVKDRENALAAVALAKGNLKKFTESKDALKEPALRICQKIDELARDYANPIKIEQSRVEALTNAYQAKCNAEIDALKRAELQDLQEKTKELTAMEQVGAICQHQYTDALREQATRIAELNQPVKVEGAMMKQGLEYDIMNALEAATAHPELFTIEPKRRELLAFINAPGFVSMPGVSTRLQVKVHAKAS